MTEILPLTSIRFLAGSYVFLFHLHIRWPITNNKYVAKILNSGALGMSIFFILSGYILSYRYSREKIDLKIYLTNRFARIYPIYILSALITVPWIGIGIKGIDIYQIIKIITLVILNIFLLQAWVPQVIPLWNCNGSWSISNEAFFYGLFPFIKKHISRLSKKTFVIFILLTYFLTIIPGLSCIIFDQLFDPYYFIPIYRLAEFVLGICCFEITKCVKIKNYDYYLIIIIITLLTPMIYLAKSPYYICIIHNWIAIPIVCSLVVLLSRSNGAICKILNYKWLVYLGKISYCFYSFQALMLFGLIQHKSNKGEILISFTEIVTLFLLLIAISALGYHYIEEPFRRKIIHYSLKLPKEKR